MIGVSEPENVARELDDRVLEASSGAEERHAALPRVPDGRERAFHAAIRARRRDPETVVRGEPRLGCVADRVSGHPLEGEPDMAERTVGEEMRWIFWIEVADDGNQGRRVTHR